MNINPHSPKKNRIPGVSYSNPPRFSDIYKMDSIAESQTETKQCPFCAETIQAAAVKCRFCNEFLNTPKARALEQNDDDCDQEPEEDESILFSGRPSLWAMAGAVIKASFFLVIAYFLINFPLERSSIFQPKEASASAEYEEYTSVPTEYDKYTGVPTEAETDDITQDHSWLTLTESQAMIVGKYRLAAGVGLVILVLLILLLKIFRLKMTYYEISADRIEWSRGILDRRVDNLDMFRVIDLRLRRTILDCIFGIGTVILITNDKTDPEFVFEKVRNSRRLYDIIKKASLEADKRDGVIHLE